METSTATGYKVDKHFEPMAASLRETLLYFYYNKGLLASEDDGILEFWFEIHIFDNITGIPAILVKGGMRDTEFMFHSDASRSGILLRNGGDAENAFHEFAMKLNYLRKLKGLMPFDYDRFYDIDREGIPDVTADNYSLLPVADLAGFLDLLNGKAGDICVRNTDGKYSVIRYSEDARITECFCRENIPVYQSFLADFRRFYGFNDAAFVFCRRGKEQYVFFHVKDKGLYHNIGDGSLEFMKEENPCMKTLLADSAGILARGLADVVSSEE